MTSLGERVVALERRAARAERRLRILTIGVVLFLALHLLLIPLLPTLFAHALQASVGALVLGVVVLVLYVTDMGASLLARVFLWAAAKGNRS